MNKRIAILLIAVVVLSVFGVGCSMNRSGDAQENHSVPAQTVESSAAPVQKTEVTQEQPVEEATGEAAVQNTEVIQEHSVKETVEAPAAVTEITLDDAKRIALEDAGIAEADALRLHGRLDYDDGRKIYDVEFYAGNTEYDYEILADSGEIFERNIETHAAPQSQTEATEQISVDQAKENAAGHAGVALADADFTKARLEKDDGREEYEIEFTAGGRRYEYVIDPYTGEILESEID